MKRKDSLFFPSLNPILSYIEPINYNSKDKKKVKSVDFKKMISRQYDLPVRSPSIGIYNMVNESISKRSEELQKKSTRKRINKYKFLSHYNPSLTYRIVKLEKSK
jgi:hypothetical protein